MIKINLNAFAFQILNRIAAYVKDIMKVFYDTINSFLRQEIVFGVVEPDMITKVYYLLVLLMYYDCIVLSFYYYVFELSRWIEINILYLKQNILKFQGNFILKLYYFIC